MDRRKKSRRRDVTGRPRYEELLTEQRNRATFDIDSKSIIEVLDIINREDRKAVEAVGRVRHEVARAVELVVGSFNSGGRLIYVGAGTSGRLGVLDAAECPPTFGTRPGLVQGIIAGGRAALVRSQEGAEDDATEGKRAIRARRVSHRDTVLGIASSGVTSFVVGALEEAKRRDARVVALVSTRSERLSGIADPVITVLVGPEVITGSTRMKAGTATKLILNMITTTAMIRMGKVYENLMVDLKPISRKLRDRAVRIIRTITAVDRREAERLLSSANGNVKAAIVMKLAGVPCREAIKRLKQAGGLIRNTSLCRFSKAS